MSSKAAVVTDMASRASSVALERFTDKAVVRTDDPLYLGSAGEVGLTYVSARTALVIDPEGDFIQEEGIGDRTTLEHYFGGKFVAINADIAAIFDQDFELLGSNAVSADMETDVTGGLIVATHGAATDSAIIAPHLDTEQSPWTLATWLSQKSVRWDCLITTGAAIVNETIWLGLKKTNTDAISTDDDQVFFRYAAGTDTNWMVKYSIATADTSVDSGVLVAVSTTYHFTIDISAARVARFFINGTLVATTTALTSAVSLIPYVGILSAVTASAKTLTLRKMKISKVAA